MRARLVGPADEDERQDVGHDLHDVEDEGDEGDDGFVREMGHGCGGCSEEGCAGWRGWLGVVCMYAWAMVSSQNWTV